MNCPLCHNTSLIKTQRQGFLIDYCPDCRGIWFERGELDKILIKLNQIDIPEKVIPVSNPIKTPTEKVTQSAILDSIYTGKELHNLQASNGKHHWMHRLFD